MSAEQTPDIERVLAEVKRGRCLNCLRMLATDEDWANTEEGERPDLCWENNVYSCGWVPETTLEALQAQALAPVLAAAVREAEQRALREAAEALNGEPDSASMSQGTDEAVRIIEWLRDRADRITEPVPHEAATSGEEASKA